MRLLFSLIGLLAFVAAENFDDEMVPLEARLAKTISSAHLQVEFGKVQIPKGHSNKSTDPIAARIITLLEGLRPQFGEGTGMIPSLDPYRHSHVGPVNIQYPVVIRGDLNVNDIEIRGLRNFIINNISFSFVGLSLSFDFSLPNTSFASRYSLRSRVGGIIPYNPSGNARINIDNLNIAGHANLGSRAEDHNLKLLAFKIVFDLSKIHFDIEGMIGNGVINKTFNWVLNQLSTRFIQRQRERISAFVSLQLHDVIDNVLKDFSLQDLLFPQFRIK